MENEIKITCTKDFSRAIKECSNYLIKQFHECNDYKERLIILWKIRQILAINYVQGTIDYYNANETYEELKTTLIKFKEWNADDEILIGSSI